VNQVPVLSTIDSGGRVARLRSVLFWEETFVFAMHFNL
jgi:hypothetical protein